MKITNPKDVKYLALEGGGGKGVTYLGAIRALEKLGVLPINIDQPGENQIKGISGASAGAITALMLALGMDSAKLNAIMSKPEIFNAFFEKPSFGLYRSVDRNNKPQISKSPDLAEKLDSIHKQDVAEAMFFNVFASVLPNITSAAAKWLATKVAAANSQILTQILRYPQLYVYNLIFDRGIFPGFEPRAFFAKLIGASLERKIRKYTGGRLATSPNGGDLNFELFHRMTGVDLVITGTNVTKHKPGIFSKRHTPDFPVAEAVSISMSLPILFKPVYVQADVPVGQLNANADDYHGFWIDGGFLNNFPLHAFDYLQPPISNEYPHLRPLNSNMLGLRLTDGPDKSGPRSDEVLIHEHLGDLLDTMLYPSEQGQIRSPDEADQTIDLFTYSLKTTNFAPSESERAVPIAEAERTVIDYFKDH